MKVRVDSAVDSAANLYRLGRMDLIRILNELWNRRLWVVAATVVALLVGISTNYKLPSFEKRAQLVGAATSQVLIDSSTSAIADVDRDPGPLANRAVVLAQYMSSAEARAAIAKKMGLSPTQIAADGPFSTLTDRSTYQATPAGPAGQPADRRERHLPARLRRPAEPADHLDLHPGAGRGQRHRPRRRGHRGPDRIRRRTRQGNPHGQADHRQRARPARGRNRQRRRQPDPRLPRLRRRVRRALHR